MSLLQFPALRKSKDKESRGMRRCLVSCNTRLGRQLVESLPGMGQALGSIPTHGQWRQKDQKFKVILDYIASLSSAWLYKKESVSKKKSKIKTKPNKYRAMYTWHTDVSKPYVWLSLPHRPLKSRGINQWPTVYIHSVWRVGVWTERSRDCVS